MCKFFFNAYKRYNSFIKKIKNFEIKIFSNKKSLWELFLESIKRFIQNVIWVIIAWYLIFLITTLIYKQYSWIGVKRFNDKQIESQIIKDLWNEEYSIKVIKKDFKWFWNESILVIAWFPGIPDYNINYKYSGSKILIYEKIQKNTIENALFQWELYQKNHEIILKNVIYSWNETVHSSYYWIWGYTDLDVWILLNFTNLNCWSSCIEYYWILKYDLNFQKYTFEPFLDKEESNYRIKETLDCFEMSDDMKKNMSEEEISKHNLNLDFCKSWFVYDLFNNKVFAIIENGIQKDIVLTEMRSDHFVHMINKNEIHIFYSLWWKLDFFENESHADSHNYLQIIYRPFLWVFRSFFDDYKIHYVDWKSIYNNRSSLINSYH
jgi:hypothetical protein